MVNRAVLFFVLLCIWNIVFFTGHMTLRSGHPVGTVGKWKDAVFGISHRTSPAIDVISAGLYQPESGGLIWKESYEWEEWHDPGRDHQVAYGSLSLLYGRSAGIWAQTGSYTFYPLDVEIEQPVDLTLDESTDTFLAKVRTIIVPDDTVPLLSQQDIIERGHSRIHYKSRPMGYVENAIFLLIVGLAVHATIWLFRHWPRYIADGVCSKCGYQLCNLTTNRCPECGCEFR